MAEESALIEVKNLSINYDDFAALRDVHLTIQKGNITALVGPSGCGKSSFLQSLNRLTDLIPGCQTTGEMILGGKNILSPGCDVLSLRRKVGMVFQKPNPFPQSIRRNFEIPLREHGFSKLETTDRMEDSLKRVGLWNEVSNRLSRSAANLSGGQQQRLCIARALALDPEVILFDEPCSALDPHASGVVEDLISSLRGSVTVVIVTHNLAQARRIADHLAVFWVRGGSGTIVETGATDALFTSATDPDAKSYLTGIRG
ncbi:MAG: phosphate ABC transporter ATP-binding protein [Verrucomicrobiales bacterium]|nr:phosphate ABC transporter ATP-binding protein [Verrucomicrobiales bacterium]